MAARSKIRTIVKEYLIITLACFFFGMAWEGFMIPNGMSAGGMMGLCTVIQYATNGLIEAQYSYMAINIMLILIAMCAMGIGFGFKTIYCILMSTFVMKLIGDWDFLHSVPGEFFFVEETLLIPIIAGVLEAAGIGLVLRFGGSTGGTDIVALMVNKYWPVSLSTAFLVSDLIVCSLLLLLPEKNFSDMCYGLTELVTFSLMIDWVVGGTKSNYQLMVFSDKNTQIADHIINNMDRGVTILKAQGWFTKKEKNVLLVIINKKQLPEISRVIKDIDGRAFMSVSPVGSVYGEGFEEIKAGVRIKKKKTNINESE